MGITAQPNHFFHCEFITYKVVLGQHADLPGTFGRLFFFDIIPVQKHLPGITYPLGNGIEHGGFTGAVGADDHQPLALPHLKAYIIHHGVGAVADGQILYIQHGAHPFRVW